MIPFIPCLVAPVKIGVFLFSVYRFSKKGKNAKGLIKNTKRCGPLGIKLIQYILMREVIKDKDLEFAFENCDIHPYEETQKLYLKDFGHPIEDDYLVDGVVASGSIGQVYKAYSKVDGKEVALKVKHPGINKQIKCFSRIIRVFSWIFRTRYHNIILEYLDNINIQLDYIQEAENTKLLYYKWRNESCVIVPEVYSFTSNFIAMSFHNGQNYNELNEKTQLKASLYMNLILLQSLLVHDFLHCDLHTGNWKVIVGEDNKIQILLYDCGIMCETGSLEYNKQLIKNLFAGRFTELVYLMSGEKSERSERCANYINNNLPTDSHKRTRFLLNTLLKWDLIVNKDPLDVITAFSLIGEICGSSSKLYMRYVETNEAFMYECLVYIYIGLLERMDNDFSELHHFFKEWMDSDIKHKERYESWLFERFGHKRRHILDTIIYKKFT